MSTPRLGKWWSKRVPASVNTGSAPQIERKGNEDLCDCFPPPDGAVGVGPGRLRPTPSDDKPLK